ncbi:phosphoinositide 3-kinase adapter protein 1 isoform X1 [Diabrotica virgifera virgifera]|uniref:DBB domain-containing protein n=2 Tax=Diabrotica virgifera virgifera TaxID=50390 RepID=A0ABM5IAG8_DIAVI|nr:phosphoinositide 3-kinase adapter protein 1 isoform X1 [Diabrotica virgifera virgifera]XP_028128583.2 phosphoinositide 3-kinase adapter protein 1 isoform X1 [Diabrotica virgifera virgifera]
MDFDNPSYFSMANGNRPSERKETWGSTETSFIKQLTPPRGGSWYKERRMYLRSVSSNSADSNQELLIKGEPRLSDIAPDLSFKGPPSRSSSIKSQKSDFITDLSYLPRTLSEEPVDIFSENEVFDSENTERYHNFTPMERTSQRRHSIGTFVAAPVDNRQTIKQSDTNLSTTLSKNVKEVEVEIHSTRQASYPRKRCIKSGKGTPKNINMDDILIISVEKSEAASLWVDYFSNYFQQISKHANRKPFRIQHSSLEEIISKTEEEHADFISRATSVKLQLVVMCPSFLEIVADRSEECMLLEKILLAEKTLALLLGVTDDDFNEVHKKVLPTYFQWHRKCVGHDQDENFTKEFLGQAMTILSKVWKQQMSIISQDKSYFSISPKKIRQGQNSVLVILTFPLQKDDVVKISVEKNGELFVINNVKKRNPYLLKFWMPESLTEITAIVNILVEKNGNIIGSRPMKCESRLRELEEILRNVNNPIDFMCQSIGFSPSERDNIDNWLVHNFQRNLPPHFNILGHYEQRHVNGATQGYKRSHEEFPTLLHFSAKFGLEKLTLQLLECPGADVAYEIRNIYDLTPLEMAEANGFSEMATMLRGVININEFTSIYAKLMEMSLTPKPGDRECDGYMVPKSMQQFYKICPAPRPVIKDDNLNFPSTSSNEWQPNLEYIPMHTPVSVPKEEQPLLQRNNSVNKEEPIITICEESIDAMNKSMRKNKKSEDVEDRVQKELAEIINDFKNNIHSITQAERLVEEWKNRNDVQKSFKEKQEQLTEMRIKYDQIQSKMKTAMKKPTPFERMRKLFSKPKHDHQQINSSANSDSSSLNNRPLRSLSTSSSGSSGRVSSISACSLGDSGTLSDNEERALMLGKHSEEEIRNDLNKAVMELNYNTLPIPKPKKLPIDHSYQLIEESSLVGSLDSPDDFYIQYPPSGLPIPGFEDYQRQESFGNEYTNIEASKTTQTTHEYMNFKVPTLSKPL